MKTHSPAWSYGTRKQVKVLHAERIQWRGKTVCVVRVIEEKTTLNFVLMRRAAQTARPGDRATITFTQGGPSGGYWKYEPAQP